MSHVRIPFTAIRTRRTRTRRMDIPPTFAMAIVVTRGGYFVMTILPTGTLPTGILPTVILPTVIRPTATRPTAIRPTATRRTATRRTPIHRLVTVIHAVVRSNHTPRALAPRPEPRLRSSVMKLLATALTAIAPRVMRC